MSEGVQVGWRAARERESKALRSWPLPEDSQTGSRFYTTKGK